MFRKIFILGLSYILSTGFVAAEYNLTIIHTNDVHAQFEPRTEESKSCTSEENSEGQCYGGSARLATAIADARVRADNSILVDGGDAFWGTKFFEYYEGRLTAEIMNLLNYDAMVAGNHEFDKGIDIFTEFLDATEFPVLITNVDTSGIPGLSEKIPRSVIVERGGERLGLIGVTLQDIYEMSEPGTDLIFTDPVEAVQIEVDRLEASGINKIILLSHLGYTADKRLAAATHGLDVIVGGHSHIYLLNNSDIAVGPYPTMVGDTALVQVFANSKYLGELNIRFDDQGVLLEATGDPTFLGEDVVEDQEMIARVAAAAEPLTNFNERIIGYASALIDGASSSCRLQECALGNLIADAMLARVKDRGIQIAVYNAGVINASIDEGEITMHEVKKALRYTTLLSRFQISGEDLLEALEHSVSETEGQFAGFLHVGGLRFKFDPTGMSGSRISDVRVREGGGFVPIVPRKIYGIVSSTRIRQGRHGYTMFQDARYAYDYGPAIHDVVAEYLTDNSPYTPFVDGRIEGRVEGNGVARFPDGSVYEGEFVNGAPEGQGKITFADGGTYEGGWVDGVISGTGTAVYANGVVYTGDFANAVHHGVGTMTNPNGYIYVGDWVEGNKDGLGIARYPDGVRYAGGFSNDVRRGIGLVIFPNSTAQFGNWVEGQTTARVANSHTVVPALRNEFGKLSIEQRKLVQEVIKSEGLYKSPVDGQWGKNTLWALAQYAIREIHSINLDDKRIASQLISSLLVPFN